MTYETIICKNFCENRTTIYYASNHAAACEWKRSIEADMDTVEWVEGRDYSIGWGDDVELESLSDDDDYERPWGAPYGIYRLAD